MATTNKSTGKSGFEIRLEVLQMARDFMESQTKLNAKFAGEAFDIAVRANKATVEQWKEYAPTTYTVEDVMAKATELYKFIAPTK
jgi:hypothetical protein